MMTNAEITQKTQYAARLLNEANKSNDGETAIAKAKKSVEIFQSIFNQTEDTNDAITLAEAGIDYAKINEKYGRSEDAIVFTEQSLKLFEGTRQSTLNFSKQQNLSAQSKAKIKLEERINQIDEKIAKTQHLLAILYFKQASSDPRFYSVVEKLAMQALGIYRRLHHKDKPNENILASLFLLAETFHQKRENDKAKIKYEKALEMSLKVHDNKPNETAINVLLRLAHFDAQHKNYAAAEIKYTQAFEMSFALKGLNTQMATIFHRVGDLHAEQGDHALARKRYAAAVRTLNILRKDDHSLQPKLEKEILTLLEKLKVTYEKQAYKWLGIFDIKYEEDVLDLQKRIDTEKSGYFNLSEKITSVKEVVNTIEGKTPSTSRSNQNTDRSFSNFFNQNNISKLAIEVPINVNGNMMLNR